MKNKPRLRLLSIPEILGWADAFREATGKWPSKSSGPIPTTKFEVWAKIDNALRSGLRGLTGGSSLALLLAEKRGVRHIRYLPQLTVEIVLKWADNHFRNTRKWPTRKSGKVLDAQGEKWQAIDSALILGARGFSEKSSLAQLLAEHRGVRNRKNLPPLSEEQILDWADAHYQRTGFWPGGKAGPIADAPGESWMGVAMALSHGRRGFPGGSSLALLLAEKRGVRNTWTIPNLSIDQILGWADAFFQRTGKWPNLQSGPIPEAPGETWLKVNKALRNGLRGLQEGDLSLAKLLASEKGVRNQVNLPLLNRKQILKWADAHKRRTGIWPTRESGPIAEAPDETWKKLDSALRDGNRSLKKGSSLARFLSEFRGKRNRLGSPRLSFKKILAWADAHFTNTGKWPNKNAGDVIDAQGEQWISIDAALRQGHRGLSGRSSLLQLLVRKRGLLNPLNLPLLTEKQILGWADLHWNLTGRLPQYKSGPIVDAPGETWSKVDNALRGGKRGLMGNRSLAKFLAENSDSFVST